MSARQVSYKQPTSRVDCQGQRRLDALQAQRARRSDTLDRIRGIEDIENCFLSDSEEERFADADENQVDQSDAAQSRPGSLEQPVSLSCELSSKSDDHNDQGKSRHTKDGTRKYKRFSNRCMRAELLDLSDSLPIGFEQDWIMVGPVPKGQRCIVLTSSFAPHAEAGDPGGRRPNTLVLSRSTASIVGYFNTVVPLGCILDCIYSPEKKVLWILDVLKWKEQSLIDCEADFRFYWRDIKFQELPLQSLSHPNHLLAVPVPYLPTCPRADTFTLTSSLIASKTTNATVTVWVPNGQPACQPIEICDDADGLLMYLRSATYESGETVLAGWVPLLPVGSQGVDQVGVLRLNTLCRIDHQMLD